MESGHRIDVGGLTEGTDLDHVRVNGLCRECSRDGHAGVCFG